MYPLVLKDSIRLAFWGAAIMYGVLVNWLLNGGRLRGVWAAARGSLMAISSIGLLTILVLMEFFPPPQKYPDLYTYFCVAFSCLHFLGFYFYFHLQLFFYYPPPAAASASSPGQIKKYQ